VFDKIFKLGVNAGLAILAAIVVVAIIAVAQLQSLAQTPPGMGPTSTTLRVVPTLRSVTISSDARDFTRCGGGRRPWRSTKLALGFPNGYCSVGRLGKAYPIKIKNGLEARILVETSSAVPSDGGQRWLPCERGSDPAVLCNGPSNRPGKDQFAVKNFSMQEPSGTEITSSPVCDIEFQPGGCAAVTGQLQREALVLTGPSAPDDNATKWRVTIIWMAAPMS
jgi:hypothetical protein